MDLVRTSYAAVEEHDQDEPVDSRQRSQVSGEVAGHGNTSERVEKHIVEAESRHQ